jgi:phosphate transporter
VVAWLIIIYFVQPDDIQSIPAIVYERGNAFSKRNVTVMSLTIFTLLLFAFFTYLKPVFGDIGIVSLCFVAIMFGSGMLSEVGCFFSFLRAT